MVDTGRVHIQDTGRCLTIMFCSFLTTLKGTGYSRGTEVFANVPEELAESHLGRIWWTAHSGNGSRARKKYHMGSTRVTSQVVTKIDRNGDIFDI